MPGRKWYVVAGLIFLVGFAVFAVFLILRIRAIGEGLDQVVVPGSAEVTLEKPGRTTIYHETGSSLGGIYYGTSDLTGLEVVVTSPAGQTVPLLPPTMNESYEYGGRRGTAIFKFDAPEAGTYRVEASYPGGTGPDGVLTVGRGLTTSILVTVFGGLAIAGGSAILALVIAAVTFYRRYRAKRRLPAPAPGPNPEPRGPPPPLAPPRTPPPAPPRPPTLG